MRYNNIIIHFDEIALKGKNRPFFEHVLVNNIKEFLKNVDYEKIQKDGGKIFIKISEKNADDKSREAEYLKNILKNIPGISNFYFGVLVEKDLKKINEKIVLLLNDFFKSKKTFKIEAKRTDKKFMPKSPEINAMVGEDVLKYTKLKVDVHNPDVETVIDIGYKNCFIYFEKISGIGGLPTGTAGNLISLLSGGIDSPVAGYMMMKRGAKIVYVHFKNKTIAGDDGSGKIKSLVKKLSNIQGRSKLYIVPFEEFQKEIIAKIPAKNRMISYRRVMFKLAEIIAEKEKAKGFITGDSLSQVASQTLENINVIYKAANYPVFAPLIGMNKKEITDLACKIGTYKISILPYQDCCSFLIAKHPETRGVLEEVLKQEENLKTDEIAKEVMNKIKPEIIQP